VSVDISVIIPLYNKSEYIERTLRSVFNQDVNNWECIIVDDGSTDGSAEKVANFIIANPGNWKLVAQANSGQTSARNHGVEIAQGQYLAFLDADDLWPEDKLRLQHEALEGNPAATLVLSAFAIFRDHTSTPRVVRHKNPRRMNERWLLMSGFGGGLESVGMVRRNSLLKENLFDPILSTSSGLDLSLRLSELGQIILLPNIGLYYRINSGQWHADTDELNRNLEILSKRYQGGLKQNLDRSHSAYLYWISARSHGKRFLAFAVLHALLNLKNVRFYMLLNLVSRNIISGVLGRSLRHETLPIVRRLDS